MQKGLLWAGCIKSQNIKKQKNKEPTNQRGYLTTSDPVYKFKPNV